MLSLQVNDKPVKCPVCWEESTVRVYQNVINELAEGDNNIKVFSVLTRTNYTSLWDETSEILEAEIYRATAFVFNQPHDFRDKPMPKSIKLRGKIIPIPSQIQKMTVGQNFHIRSAMAPGKPLEGLISLACAVYLQPLVDGSKFDWTSAKQLEEEILEMNIYEVFPIGFFLLSKLNNSGASGLLAWLQRKLSRVNSILSSLKLPASISWKSSTICLISTYMLLATGCHQGLCKKSHSMRLYHSFGSGKSETNIRPDFRQQRTL